MSGRISWERYPGEDIEQIAATFICRERKDSVHVRPSQGDRGVDVRASNEDGTYDIYQVKRFTALDSSRKRQVKKSWQRMLECLDDEDITISHWYLVMPFDPTFENLRWFQHEFSSPGIEASWLGLTCFDSWAAKMPEVIDYYLENGSAEIMRQVRDFLTAAQSPDLTNPDKLREQLHAIESMLDSHDPHYAYSIHLYSKFEASAPPVVLRTGLVATMQERFRDGSWLVVDVIAKHAAATELAPMKSTIKFLPQDDAENEELQNFYDYGTPLNGIHAKVKDYAFPFCLPAESEGLVSTFDVEQPHHEIKVKLRTDTGCVLSLRESRSSHGKKGIHWQGADSEGVLSLSMNLGSEASTCHLSYDLSAAKGRSVGSLKRVFAILADFGAGAKMELSINDMPIGRFSTSDSREGLVAYTELFDVLNTIDSVSEEDVVFPDVSRITNGQFKCWSDIAKLYRAGSRVRTWAKLSIEEVDPISLALPLLFTFIQQIDVEIDGHMYGLSPVECTGIAEGFSTKDKVIVLKPGSTYVQSVIERVVKPEIDDPSLHGIIFVREAPSIIEWQEAVASSSNRFSVLKNENVTKGGPAAHDD